MDLLSIEIVFMVLEYLSIIEIYRLIQIYAENPQYEQLVAWLTDYKNRNQSRAVPQANNWIINRIVRDLSRLEDPYFHRGCAFYSEGSLLQIGDEVWWSKTGPSVLTPNGRTEPSQCSWVWKKGAVGAAGGSSSPMELWVSRNPAVFESLEMPFDKVTGFIERAGPERFRINSTNFSGPGELFFESFLPRPAEESITGGTDLCSVLSSIHTLQTLILKAPVEYYVAPKTWWAEEDWSYPRERFDRTTSPLKPLLSALSSFSNLTVLCWAFPLRQWEVLEDATVFNGIFRAVPRLKSLIVTDIPPRVSCSVEKIDFGKAMCLQTLRLYSLVIPLEQKKPYRSDLMEITDIHPACILLGSIRTHLERFVALRDFNDLFVRLLLGDYVGTAFRSARSDLLQDLMETL
ncbi:hypothetical protein AOL_s00088g4 [Orbilia oligospora ATCC 24927]|uniref:Uncharacterized protein n=1 Tax=Arthrobotrys oligospora (strain ATCC 24927 / CBS 115.81 / DSM 1491) TaxID=756982 RepID=G1XHP1_ARTOA|nr:hypothetical protein AOL_s00088g4 [Orbilia oligospora ATCC 24927]EGX47289.1 hypothetical protein AOL_s00088g4 [Orbilia oligospora ATCC 24927]